MKQLQQEKPINGDDSPTSLPTVERNHEFQHAPSTMPASRLSNSISPGTHADIKNDFGKHKNELENLKSDKELITNDKTTDKVVWVRSSDGRLYYNSVTREPADNIWGCLSDEGFYRRDQSSTFAEVKEKVVDALGQYRCYVQVGERPDKHRIFDYAAGKEIFPDERRVFMIPNVNPNNKLVMLMAYVPNSGLDKADEADHFVEVFKTKDGGDKLYYLNKGPGDSSPKPYVP